MSTGFYNSNVFTDATNFSFHNSTIDTQNFVTQPAGVDADSFVYKGFDTATIGVTAANDLAFASGPGLLVGGTDFLNLGDSVDVGNVTGDLIAPAGAGLNTLLAEGSGSGTVDYEIWGGDATLTAFDANMVDSSIIDGSFLTGDLAFTDGSVDLGDLTTPPDGTIVANGVFEGLDEGSIEISLEKGRVGVFKDGKSEWDFFAKGLPTYLYPHEERLLRQVGAAAARAVIANLAEGKAQEQLIDGLIKAFKESGRDSDTAMRRIQQGAGVVIFEEAKKIAAKILTHPDEVAIRASNLAINTAELWRIVTGQRDTKFEEIDRRDFWNLFR